MIVYHGSTQEIQKPDINHSSHNLDFGKGFYVTTVKQQAERWANRKADLADAAHGIVTEYEMSDENGSLIVKDFGDDLDNWIDFVCACRDGDGIYKEYDIISGKVANDKVYRVVDMYRRKIWDKERAIQEMRAYEAYDQIAFITQHAIDDMLTFMCSYEVKTND